MNALTRWMRAQRRPCALSEWARHQKRPSQLALAAREIRRQLDAQKETK